MIFTTKYFHIQNASNIFTTTTTKLSHNIGAAFGLDYHLYILIFLEKLQL